MICIACRRDDLPCAAAFPPRAGVVVAHVNAKCEPCRERPDVYDAEVLQLIVTEDKMWALDFQRGSDPTGAAKPQGAEGVTVPSPPVGSHALTPPAPDKLEAMKADAAFGPPPPEKPKKTKKKSKKTEPDDAADEVDNWEP